MTIHAALIAACSATASAARRKAVATPKRSVFETYPICFFGQPYICKSSMEKPETLKLNPVDHTAGPYA
jgi:hypothetical protein